MGKPKTAPTKKPAATSTAVAEAPAQEQRVRASEQLCPWHHVPVVSYATKGPFTYCKCPVAGCDFRHKALRPGTGGIPARKR
jgi:hypothetical protein